MVYSYGRYMRKFVQDTKARGAIPIICSPVPRNNFKDGKVSRSTSDYGLWAKQTVEQSKAFFIELNGKIADEYDKMGAEAVNKFFPTDHAHTDDAGAKLNVGIVVSGIKELQDCTLKNYLWR